MTTPYYDVDAEECLVGACLIAPSAIETAARALVPEDFGSPHLASAYAAQLALHRQGARIDVHTLVDELRRTGTLWDDAPADLVGWVANTGSTAAVGRYAEIIQRYASKRALRLIATDLLNGSADATSDPSDLVDDLWVRLAELDSPALVKTPGDQPLEEFVAETDSYAEPVIPGLLDEDHRVVLVAAEGSGKSELMRQLVVCTAFGIDPFTGRPIPAMPALLVDLENPRRLLRSRLNRLISTATTQARGERAPATLWHRPGGIDLRKRSDRVALEDVLRRNRPKLVALGPVYKAYSRSGRETDEHVASEVQAVLDDLRTRFGCALVLEHHAPQASNGVRDLRPFGSSLWLRWPETGLKLAPHRDIRGALIVGRWRGDRTVTAWPDELRRGDVWPWAGWWKDGVPDGEDW